jgi:hypothetical protein
VKSFISNLHLKWVPVQGLAIGSLDLPLITALASPKEIEIEIEREREREITYI